MKPRWFISAEVRSYYDLLQQS